MNVLSIETSCDETAISLVTCSLEGGTYSFDVRANNLLSQASLHAEYGGVFPSLAKREHAKAIVPLIEKTLIDAGVVKREKGASERLKEAQRFLEREEETKHDLERLSVFDPEGIEAIAITVGPGLAPALWVGVNTARALSTLWDIPLIPVNHMHGHLFSALFPNSNMFEPPSLGLLVSGGHTEILKLSEDFSIEILGSTRDDAIGEAFDKAARLLDLGYPGGARISEKARIHREKHPEHKSALFPRPMIGDKSLDVSYSGLKTALLYHLKEHPITGEEELTEIAREFEDAALDVILAKVARALDSEPFQSLSVGGGVIANTELRKRITELADDHDIKLYIPEMELTTDNSLMIAVAGYVALSKKRTSLHTNVSEVEAEANLASNFFLS